MRFRRGKSKSLLTFSKSLHIFFWIGVLGDLLRNSPYSYVCRGAGEWVLTQAEVNDSCHEPQLDWEGCDTVAAQVEVHHSKEVDFNRDFLEVVAPEKKE